MNDKELAVAEEAFLKRVMLVVDGSQAGDAAALFAFRFARRLNCPLVAVYTIDTATMDYLLQMHIFVSDERNEMEQALEAKGRNYLDRTRRMGEAWGVQVETKIMRGAFHQAVLQQARQQNADAIIIGGWKRSSHDKDTFSTERELVMDLAACPVIVVKG
jgi:nucleotide-binding universal stress UspA family protein